MQWIAPPDQGYVNLTAGGVTILASLTVDEPLTVTRSRGLFSFGPAAPSVNAEIKGAFGMGVVSAEAFAAGVASMPRPFENANWGGWFVWRSFAELWDVTTDVGRAIMSVNMEINSKAMRKVPPNSVIVQLVDSQGGHDAQVFTGVRMLVKLS